MSLIVLYLIIAGIVMLLLGALASVLAVPALALGYWATLASMVLIKLIKWLVF